MSLIDVRARLLGGAIISVSIAAIAASPAQAACNLATSAVTCDTTATTHTSNAGGSPASDRAYQANTAVGDFTGTITAGSTVSGYGLSFSDAVGSGNGLNIVNNGTIQVDAGNTPFVGGEAALNILTYGPTHINYSGVGSIANLGGGISTDGLFMESVGTGNIVADIGGDVIAVGAATRGVTAFQDGPNSGSIGITTAAGTTIRASSTGIYAAVLADTSGGAIHVVNAGTILSSGAPNSLGDGIYASSYGLGPVAVANSGMIGSISDRLAGTGIGADISNAASFAVISVTGSGALYANNFGIHAQSLGTGAVIVDYSGAISSNLFGVYASSTSGAVNVTTGAVTTNVSNGIVTQSTTGDQTITVNGAVTSAAVGVNAVSASGAITFNVNGNVTGYDGAQLNSAGAKVINVQAGRSLLGTTGFDLRAGGGGTALVNIAGSVGNRTDHTAVYMNDFITAATIDVASGGSLTGAVDLSDLDDAINNRGTWTVGAANYFYGGSDTVSNLAGGTINLSTGARFSGLDSYNNAANSTTNVAGAVDLGGAALANAGNWNLATASAVTDLGVTSNTGVINAGAGSSIESTANFTNAAGGRINVSGPFSLASTGAFSNAGTLALAPTTFTLSGATAFTNSGTIRAEGGATTIFTSVSLANDGTIDLQDGAANDVLTIAGNFVGSGNSVLAIDFAGGAADRLVVTGTAGGSTRLNISAIGPVSLDLNGALVVDTGTSSTDTYVLGSQSTGNPLISFGLEKRGQDYYLVAAPSDGALDAEGLPDLASDLWFQSADAYTDYAAAKRSDLNSGNVGFGVWAQAYLGRDNEQRRVETNRRGFQGGADYNFGQAVVGVTAGWQKAGFERQATRTGFGAKGWNAGLYGIFGRDLGIYGGVLVKHDLSGADASRNGALADVRRVNLKTNGAEGEVGYRLGAGNARVSLGAGIAWVSSKIEGFEAGGIRFEADRAKSLRGRAGFRVESAKTWGPFVSAELLHEFRDNNKVAIGSGSEVDLVGATGRGTWVRFEAGIGSHDRGGPIAALWGLAGDVQGFGAKLGWRFGNPAQRK